MSWAPTHLWAMQRSRYTATRSVHFLVSILLKINCVNVWLYTHNLFSFSLILFHPDSNLHLNEQVCSYRHSRAWRTIMNAFEILASQWRIFGRLIACSTTNAASHCTICWPVRMLQTLAVPNTFLLIIQTPQTWMEMFVWGSRED